MKDLENHDWKMLVSAICTLNSDFDTQTLEERTMSAAAEVVGADSVAFTGFRPDGVFADMVWENSDGYSAEEMEVFAAYVHENPLLRAFFAEKRKETLAITDLMPRREFERTGIYNEFYKLGGVTNQLVTPMRISDELVITCSINIASSDFSERDKAILTLIAPHLANAIRNAFAYQRLSGALETEGCGIVAFGSDGKAVYVSEFSRLLFRKYFADEKLREDGLPSSLVGWLDGTRSVDRLGEYTPPPLPLKRSSRDGEMTVRLDTNRQIGEQTLMLEEKRQPSSQIFELLGLTPREAEILLCITQGKSDSVIALLLGTSIRTVHKHVEHIYVKLGVETRTAAMLRGFELI